MSWKHSLLRTSIFISFFQVSAAYANNPICEKLFPRELRASSTSTSVREGKQSASIQREENFSRLQKEDFDILIIGGGSAGLGAAVDAASRGLKVALVESNDFAAETSSRSTKLLHGGVRYLEQLTMTFLKTLKFDKVMYNLIRDALHERNTVLKNAPHLSKPLPIVTPIYHSYEVPYYWAGLKAYDALAGKSSRLPGSRFISASELKRDFPMIKQEGLKGGVVYYDGQFNDARMAVALAMTAQESGVAIVNHARVTALSKGNGEVNGATVQDSLDGQIAQVRAKVVVNATGPFSDVVRKMDDSSAKPMIAAAAGTHIVLPKKFVPAETGMLIPKTDDGRVLFVLPWEGHTLVGTTDAKSEVLSNPKATEEDIQYILGQVGKYYDTKPAREDVLSHWTGIRPLVSDPKSQDTAKLARDHVVQVSDSKLVTIAGGKWTTYRKMAMDVIDTAIRIAGLQPRTATSQTENLKVVGSQEYSPQLPSQLKETYNLDVTTAAYLARNYGDRAHEVMQIAKSERLSNRLTKNHPFLEAEVLYVIRNEGARTAVDIIARRMRLAFLEQSAAAEALSRVVELAGNELNWSPARRESERTRAIQELSL